MTHWTSTGNPQSKTGTSEPCPSITVVRLHDCRICEGRSRLLLRHIVDLRTSSHRLIGHPQMVIGTITPFIPRRHRCLRESCTFQTFVRCHLHPTVLRDPGTIPAWRSKTPLSNTWSSLFVLTVRIMMAKPCGDSMELSLSLYRF